jgi:hypothetical protein
MLVNSNVELLVDIVALGHTAQSVTPLSILQQVRQISSFVCSHILLGVHIFFVTHSFAHSFVYSTSPRATRR